MKIICIGRNYVAHAKELNNEIPKEPVVFMKPDSALLLKGKPFFIPEFSDNIHHELEIVVKIHKIGKHIEARFAHKYYNEITVGIDFTARDVQTELKSKGLPWEKAKAFDGAAPLGTFIHKEELGDLNNLDFSLKNNTQIVQQGNTSNMMFKIDQIIEYVSQFYTLKIGDLIYTGTPAGVAKVNIGDQLEGFIGDRKLLTVPVR